MAKKEEKSSKDDSIKNLLGSLMSGYKEDHYNEVKNERIPVSTGSLLLDSVVGLRTGSIIRFGGSFESGKTSQCLLLVAEYLKIVPKSRALYVKAEGRLSEEIQMRSGLKFVFHEDDWEYGTVFVLESNVFEAICDIIQSLLKNMHEKGEKLVFVIDSLDSLILKSDLEKKSGENVMPAGVPKMTKMFFRRLGLPINKYDSMALLTSQYSETLKINAYEKNKPKPVQGVGGSSASHQPDWIFEYGLRYDSHYLLEKEKDKPDPNSNKILGHKVVLHIRKSANEKTGYTVEIPIKHGRVGNSVWVEQEIIDLLLGWDFLKKKGGWFSFEDSLIEELKKKGLELDKQYQGLNSVREALESKPEVTDFLFKKLKNVIIG